MTLVIVFLVHCGMWVLRGLHGGGMQIAKVTPLGDRVLVKSVEAEEKTSTGIFLPSSAQKRPTQGQVVDCGSCSAPAKGDVVVYSKFAGTEVEVKGESHMLLKEDDVIGVLGLSDDISALKPLQDRILIQVEEASDTTAGGLLLTDSGKEKPTIGTVVAVGPGRKNADGEVEASTVAAGSKVLYQKFSGSEFEGKDGKEYIVVRDGDILATVA